LAHEGDLIAEEDESEYLAALACEILFCGFENPIALALS
jgi:hypothetical protein